LGQKDHARIVRGIVADQNQAGHWGLTTANALGVLALGKFAEKYEKEKVAGFSKAGYGGVKRSINWGKRPGGGLVTLPWAKAKGAVTIVHKGDGSPWVTIECRASVPLLKPISSGYQVRRSVRAVERKRPDRWSVGDIMRIKLEIDAQSDMTWVVVSDPIPAGATILGSGLGRDSAKARNSPSESQRKCPSFRNCWTCLGAEPPAPVSKSPPPFINGTIDSILALVPSSRIGKRSVK